MVQVVLLILKPAGSVGDSNYGGIAPSGNDYTKIYSNKFAFASLKTDGSITAWGDSNKGGSDAPSGNGYTKIYSTIAAFAALKIDGRGCICASIILVAPCCD
jgi:hypothetical protein